MKNKFRIGNLEFRKHAESKYKLYEIIKWDSNVYYNKEQEYRDDGYINSFGGDFLIGSGHAIDKKFFTSPETCYVICWLKINKKEPDVYIESIGSRLLDLSEIEKQDFWKVYELGNKYLYKKFKI